jgi:hypothetical protein
VKPFIYALADPLEPDHIRYVGMTMRRPKRPYEHARAARLKKFKVCHLNHWIHKLWADGREYIVRILEMFPEGTPANDVGVAERRHIKAAWDAGNSLTNCTLGGECGENATPETRAKIAKGWTTERRAEQSRRFKQLHDTVLKTPWNKGTIDAQKAWNKGLSDYLTEEQHRQLSEASKRQRQENPASEETRALMAKSQRGRKHPVKTKKKMSDSNQSVWDSRSAEDREAHKTAIKAAWAKRLAETGGVRKTAVRTYVNDKYVDSAERNRRRIVRLQKKIAKLEAEIEQGIK